MALDDRLHISLAWGLGIAAKVWELDSCVAFEAAGEQISGCMPAKS
jgi:hypothetical protein